MTADEFRDLVQACTYKPGWHIVAEDDGTRPYIQVQVDETAEASTESTGPNKGQRTKWVGAKVYLSWHMCRQEVVSAVYGALEKAEIHEAREWFRYRGASIFNPHLDPDVLVEVARRKSSFNVRTDSMTLA